MGVRRWAARGAGALLMAVSLALPVAAATDRTARAEADRLTASAALISPELHPAEALAAWSAAVPVVERAYGAQSERLARALDRLAYAQSQTDASDDAIASARRALTIEEALPVRDEKLLAVITGDLGEFLLLRHDLDGSEPYLRRSHELRLKLYGEVSAEASWSYGELSVLLLRRGRSGEALAAVRKAVEIDRALPAGQAPQLSYHLVHLGNQLAQNGSPREAETIARQAIAESANLPEGHPDRLGALDELGLQLTIQGRLEEAYDLYAQTLALHRARHEVEASCDAMGTLGFIRLNQEQLDAAETIFLEASDCYASIKNPVLSAITLMSAGTAAARRGDQALGLQRRLSSLKALEAQPSPSFVAVALAKYKLADSYAATGDLKTALKTEQEAREAIATFRDQNNPQRITADITLGWIMALDGDPKGGLALAGPAALRLEAETRKLEISQQKTTGVRENMEGLGRALRIAQLAGDAESAFHLAQVLVETDAGRAAAAESALRKASSGPVADALRERQAQMEERLKLDSQAAKAEGAQAQAVAEKIRAADARIAAAETVLDREMPQYRALTYPRPISLAEAQSKLEPDETLIVPVSTDEGLVVVALTLKGVAIDRSPPTRREIRALIGRIRTGVDASTGTRAAVDASGGADASRPGFDRRAAHELYQAIFTPKILALTNRAQVLTFATSEAFSATPFSLLVTAPPKGSDGDPAALRATPWLIRKAALQVAPSIPAMERGDEARGGGGFFGAGAPRLDGAPGAPGASRAAGFRTVASDTALVKGLAPLPGAAGELQAMARAMGIQQSTVLIGDQATEAALKKADLRSARVVAFATHGLMAGDLPGLTEPGLVFTPPDRPSEADDAILTASEAAQLKLDADWIILSACNTAAGQTGQSPGYTGLTRAFMLAGGRHVLASHWPVRDDVAARLTVDTVRRSSRGDTPARALQKAILKLIDDRSVAGAADPAVWAPFVVVGR